MPRDHVYILGGDVNTVDEDGSELPDLNAARQEAVRALPQIAQGFVAKMPTETVSIVRDETGTVLFKATMALSEEWMIVSAA